MTKTESRSKLPLKNTEKGTEEATASLPDANGMSVDAAASSSFVRIFGIFTLKEETKLSTLFFSWWKSVCLVSWC